VLWPTALPYVFTGVRLAASVALVLAVTAELVIGAPGLGQSIAVAQTSGAVPTMYALIAVTGLLGVAINLAARAFERRSLAWHQSVRGEVPA
jgi:ABC-type nitrate/sulfonate/bicarbonate transport system permease component